ncbi:phosphoglucomutase-2 [Aphis craccivora]|uniref:Phosphoglucomutase-2 n=1 Tax=Aphis craccivora TaxID=307492 RepID=A0A6G0ZER6_APHCR|nr:phosphoglucomutase-2 [Aphis craccivora]
MDTTFLPEYLELLVKNWLSWNQSQQYAVELAEILVEKNVDKIKNMFDGRLSFGTAGLRGAMSPGFKRMNDLVVVQSAQGLLYYMLSVFGDSLKTSGIIIGYDGRYNSRRFAELTSQVFLKHSVKVYLMNEVCPTPFVAFGIKLYKCCGGVMVTASHNPKEDNGYKVFWENGAQIISPIDKNIEESITEHLEPEDVWNTEDIYSNNLLVNPLIDLQKHYNCYVEKMLFPNLDKKNTNTVFTYTPMHGVGYNYIKNVFENAKFNPVVVVEQQKDPNPEFPTVPFPNPEEGKSALKLAIETAENNCSRIILANDPDADRLAVAEHPIGSNDWKIFTGNELGALLGWWVIHTYKKIYGKTNPKLVVLSSTVSSAILKSMAKIEGIKFEETLTGFKWMGNRADQLSAEGYNVIYAFEESIGYMCSSEVLDKDGISAAVKISELAIYLEKENRTLSSALELIYKQYGWHLSVNSYFICNDSLMIKKIFESIRQNDNQPNNYPKSILGGRYSIKSVRDMTTGYDSSTIDHKPVLSVSKSSQMITFHFDNGLIATLRTSGTEPKIKYYAELCSEPENSSDVNKLKSVLNEMVEGIIEEFLKPQENSLIFRNN